MHRSRRAVASDRCDLDQHESSVPIGALARRPSIRSLLPECSETCRRTRPSTRSTSTRCFVLPGRGHVAVIEAPGCHGPEMMRSRWAKAPCARWRCTRSVAGAGNVNPPVRSSLSVNQTEVRNWRLMPSGLSFWSDDHFPDGYRMGQVNSLGENRPSERGSAPTRPAHGAQPRAENGAVPGASAGRSADGENVRIGHVGGGRGAVVEPSPAPFQWVMNYTNRGGC